MPLKQTIQPYLKRIIDWLTARSRAIQQAYTRWLTQRRMELPAERHHLRSALIAVRTGTAQERWEAAAALGHFPASPEIAEALAAVLGDPEPFVRAEAAAAFARLDASVVRGPLLQALKSQQPYRVAAAAEALGRLHDAESTSPLLFAFETAEPAVRVSIVTALGQTGGAQALPALLKALNDDEPAVRWAAAGALGQLGSAEAASALAMRLAASVRRLETLDPTRRVRRRKVEEQFVKEPVMMRRRLVWSLSQVGGGSEVVPALVRALDDVDAEVRRRSALALSMLGDATVLTALGAHLEDMGDGGGGPVSEAARAAISALEARSTPAPAADVPPQES
jgi:HEAT repeat protein